MTNFLILHGTDASPDSNWFMWLKGRLIGQGYKVWLPQLPNSKTPNAQNYTKFLLANSDFKFNQDTIIIGHSSGAVEVLNLLQNLPSNTIIKAAILISAFKDNLGEAELNNLFIEPFDFKLIKNHCQKFIFIHSDNDPYCPIEDAEYLAQQCEGNMVTFDGQGHFNTEIDPKYKKFPELLDIIKNI